RTPAESFLDNLRRQPDLDVVPPMRFLDGRNIRLHFVDGRDAEVGSQAEEVDRAPLAESLERHLRNRVPAVVPVNARRIANQQPVSLVHQPLNLAATPQNISIEARAERSEDALQRVVLDSAEQAAFDSRNEVL